MTMKSAALSLAVLVVAGTLGTTTSFTAKPTCCRAPHTCLSVHSASSSAAPAVWRWASRGRHGSCEVIPPPPALEDGPLCLESARRDRTNACAPHIALKTVEGSIEPQSSSGKTVVTKAMRAFGLALAWYLASSVAALAVSGATGLPYQPRPRRRMPIAPTLFILYMISDKKIQTRNRFAGVVPQDDQSRQRLADDAYDMALSWGKPAGRIALLAVDTIFFLIIFRFSGYDFSKILVGRGMEQLRSLEFWETCSLTRQACQSAATVKGIQTLDLSSNRLSKECATQLAKALWRCRSLHEIVLEESVEEKDAEEVSSLFKECMPWATVRVDDRESRRTQGRRLTAALGQVNDEEDQGGDDFEEDNDDGDDNSHASNPEDPLHWEAFDAESDGELPPELMDDSDEDI